ncbi:MAG: MMPL family transporter, partial [Erysipelotrichaceae bacterium]|nr:MMPL family transporter [Erysipelotrichaceae bacterium]
DTTMNAIEKIKEISNDKTHVAGFSAITADTKSMVLSETPVYTAVAVALCLVVLSLGLKSWLAPFIFLAGMIYPILYNMGTNIFFGEISYITNALSMILLLAVSMDYSIFLLHRYQEEKAKSDTKEEAMAKAIHATFTSITSSSITTVAGFLALVFMQLTLGRDIGLVMAKGVILAVMSTILILPSMLMFFDPWIEKYQHKVLIRPFPKAAAWIVDHKAVFLIAFALLFIPAVYMQANAGEYYDLTASLPSDLNSVIGTNELKEKFDMTTSHFVLVDDKLTPAEMNQVIDGLENIDGVTKVVAYEKIIGPAIPGAMEPKALDEVLHQDGKRLILVNSKYRSATDEINKQLDQMTDLLHKYDKNALIAGEGAMTKDLISVTNTDFQMVNIVSIVAILIIIALTFKSISLPVILVLAIEFAIEMNMGIPYLTHTQIPFIAGIVIGTIQLGACIDYAILMTTRFKEELENGKTPKKAITAALTMTSSSIITSGLSFFAACSGVSLIARMDMIKSLCILLGRGALISVVVILTVLPGLLLISNKLISKTTKGWPVHIADEHEEHEEKSRKIKGMKGVFHHA